MLRIGVVGATGIVGQELVELLAESSLHLAELRLAASNSSVGRELVTPEGPKKLLPVDEDFFTGLDCCFFCIKAELSRVYVPQALARGVVCIDNSSAFRTERDIPVVVPEVNGHLLKMRPRLIANPNCSTAQLTVALNPILKEFGLKRVIVSTYQSVSGAGYEAVRQMEQEAREYIQGGLEGLQFCPYLFNVIPFIGEVDPLGTSGEEAKIIRETRKILEDPNLPIAVTAARVPVFRGHCQAVHFTTTSSCRIQDLRRTLTEGPNLRILDDVTFGRQPQPLQIQRTNQVWLGRIRQTSDYGDNSFAMWVAADNLRKGAAHNALLIAEAWWNAR